MAEEAAPFGEQAIHVAAAGEFLRVHDVARGFVGGHDGGDNFAGTETVAGWEAFVEIALDGGAPVGAFADRGETAETAGIRAGETIGGEEVGAVEEEGVERVAAVFECGGEGEAFGAEVTGDDGAAGGEVEFAIQDAGALPLPEWGGLRGKRKTLGAVRAGDAGAEGIAFAADEAGAAGVGAMMAGQLNVVRKERGFFGAEDDGRIGEETMCAGGGDLGRGLAGLKLAQEKRPRERSGAFQAKGCSAAEAWSGTADEDEAEFIESAAAGAADHLEEIVGRDFVFDGAEVEM